MHFNSAFFLVRANANGDSLWSRTYGTGSRDRCHSVQQTNDGGYDLGGYSTAFGDEEFFWLVKTDANGDSLWSRDYGDPEGGQICNSIQPTMDNGYILAGHMSGWTAGEADFYQIRIDSVGDTLWTRLYGGIAWDECESVQQTTDGGFILGGWTRSFGAGGSDFWLVKTDTLGIEEWSRTFGGSRDDDCYAVQQTTDGGYILGGWTASYGTGWTDFWLVRADTNGDSLWSRTFGGVDPDDCRSVQQTADEGFILGGSTESYGAGEADFWAVRTGLDPAAADPMLISPVALCTLHQNYPNPFNPSTQITFDLKKASHVSLKVFDLFGREIAALTNETHPAGTHRAAFDGSGLSSGIHFYRLQTGDRFQTKMMVLLK